MSNNFRKTYTCSYHGGAGESLDQKSKLIFKLQIENSYERIEVELLVSLKLFRIKRSEKSSFNSY